MADNWFIPAFGAHYPLLYQHRDAAEAERCLQLLPRLAPLTTGPGQRILDLGCGDGRHLDGLVELGYAATGLDLSADLLACAKDREFPSRPLELVRADMRSLPFADGSFASVLSLFTAFGYFGPPAANAAPVREVARVLAPGGNWFLDYFDGDKVRAELGSGESFHRQREVGPLEVGEERSFDASSSQVSKLVVLKPRDGFEEEAARWGVPLTGLEYTEQVAVFTLAELDALAANEGMSRIASAGGYDGQSLGDGNRWILVYQLNARDNTT